MPQVYSIKVSGINCTNCAAKIEKSLFEELKDKIIKVSVNILQEKVNVTVNSETNLKEALQVLDKIQYHPIGNPILIEGGSKYMRELSFMYQINAESEELQKIVKELPGIISVSRVHIGVSIKLTVSYNCQIIKGRQIGDIIQKKDPLYKVINHRVQSFQNHKARQTSPVNIKLTGFLCAFFLIFNMVLPFTGEWYESLVVFPKEFGIFTFAVILNICLTIYVLNIYAKPFLKRSYRNYAYSRDMNMETLVSLGCVSAFCLFLFFTLRYTLDFIYDELNDHMQAVMNINDALTSSSIIVLVVTIGKHFEGKVKSKIQALTQRIFPESTLFQDMQVRYAELKNRNLKIQKRKNYNVTLIQEGDILEVKHGRILVDTIVLNGTVSGIQSTVDGNDQILEFTKGQRIQSGSILKEGSPDALLQVQNVFQKSILIEIGTQIKLRQNEQINSQSGIQSACKTISRYFVQTVILLSISVMITWFILLSFQYVTIPTCNICWIVQRGIGVLVASCPCALGLAVPSVIAIVLNIAIKNGILIRNNGVLEKMKISKIIAFDKTGTLFTRINKVEETCFFNQNVSKASLWQIVAIMEKQVKHPLAQVLYKEAFNLCEVRGTNFNYILTDEVRLQKNGLISKIKEKKKPQQYKALIGNRTLMEQNEIQIPYYHKKSEGSTQLFLALNDECCLVMILNTHSNLRPQAAVALKKLMQNGKRVHILSGDSKQSVQKLGASLQIPSQNLHPEHSAFMKMEWIKKTQQDIESGKGEGVIMVGDGLNDIPCLQQSSIGISINAKSQLNIQAADVIMLSENLFKISALVQLLERGNQFININLFWAFLYNLIMMPIVAGVFYGYDITISPIVSSIAMSCSSITVVGFSHLLSLFTYDDGVVPEQNTKKSELEDLTDNSMFSDPKRIESKYCQLQEQK